MRLSIAIHSFSVFSFHLMIFRDTPGSPGIEEILFHNRLSLRVPFRRYYILLIHYFPLPCGFFFLPSLRRQKNCLHFDSMRRWSLDVASIHTEQIICFSAEAGHWIPAVGALYILSWIWRFLILIESLKDSFRAERNKFQRQNPSFFQWGVAGGKSQR